MKYCSRIRRYSQIQQCKAFNHWGPGDTAQLVNGLPRMHGTLGWIL